MGNKIISYDKILTVEQKEKIRKDYVENFLSIREIVKKYNIKSKMWICKFLGDDMRNQSEGNKIAHQKYPEHFKHTEATKSLIREIRLKFLKEHPEKTAWRSKNMSYPEKRFQQMLENDDFAKKYLIYREYSVFPYFIDFAFVDLKVAVEIDGSQHLEDDRKERDNKKDALLIENGWKVIRFTAKDVLENLSMVSEKLKTFLTTDKKYEKVGILQTTKKYVKVERDENGRSQKEKERNLKQRKVERPSKEDLWEMVKTKSFKQLGKEFGVSDKTIVKWCIYYKLPYKRKEIKLMI